MLSEISNHENVPPSMDLSLFRSSSFPNSFTVFFLSTDFSALSTPKTLFFSFHILCHYLLSLQFSPYRLLSLRFFVFPSSSSLSAFSPPYLSSPYLSSSSFYTPISFSPSLSFHRHSFSPCSFLSTFFLAVVLYLQFHSLHLFPLRHHYYGFLLSESFSLYHHALHFLSRRLDSFRFLSFLIGYLLSFFLSSFLSFFLSSFLPFFLPFFLSFFLPFFLSFFLPFFLSFFLSSFLPFFLSFLFFFTPSLSYLILILSSFFLYPFSFSFSFFFP
ncbi:unnamed protein product [Acanthosepion pharaonis]|uniref:Uncharacterized protein n=1 Tax=Acanthosepion pharaonis TaxID=158019 RepID=A0A812BQQ2_ACAPH|nr:unnamed protein product [Sepia pharaonis]